MADGKLICWAHGSSMQLEYPNRVTSVRHTGPFARIEGSAGQNTWVHLPVPTPTVINSSSVRVDAVLASFRARANARVHEVIVYDGDRRIAEHMDMDLRGDHLDARFEVPDTPEAGKGISVTLGLSFDDSAPDVRSMQIEVIGVGIEFLA